MRRLAVVLVLGAGLGACGARGGGGPAWPKSAGESRVGDAKDDGGESLAPRVSPAVVAVEASADDDAPAAAAPAPAAKAAEPAAGGTAPATTQPTADPDAPVILDFEEEIIIGPDGP